MRAEDEPVSVAAVSTRGVIPRRGALGRGLGALIPTPAASFHSEAGPLEVDICAIEPNPYQPRALVDPELLDELAESIRVHGIIQPLVVTYGPSTDRFVLIAGERRWRAARLAGLASVPVVIKDVSSQAMLELALVENVVRADLSPLEEAAAYRQLIDEFGLTQATVANRVGRSRVTVTNTLRLLNAPEEVQHALQQGRISEGHARALLGLPSAIDQVALLEVVEQKSFNVRQTEDAVRRWTTSPEAKPVAAKIESNRLALQIEEQIRRSLATKVSVRRNAETDSGTITIHFFNEEQLGGLLRRLVGDPDF